MALRVTCNLIAISIITSCTISSLYNSACFIYTNKMFIFIDYTYTSCNSTIVT